MSMPEFDPARRPSQSENQTILKSEIPLKERFFRYFQHEITGMIELIQLITYALPLFNREESDRCSSCSAPGTDGSAGRYVVSGR